MDAVVLNRRSARLDLRVDEADKALLVQAAALLHATLSAFVISSARDRAEAVLADRRRVVLDDDTFDAFVAALDAPTDKPALRALLAAPSPFESR